MIELPYNAEVRPDTGVTSQQLGMWLFLASEVMLFGALFSSYALLRGGAMSWPDQSSLVNLPLAAVNTVVLIVSSVAILRARTRVRIGDIAGFRRAMAATVVLGLVFLAIKGVEYAGELGEGLRPSTSNFLGLYFVMTSLHALHVAIGVKVNAYLAWPGASRWAREPARFTGRVEAAALYWNFIDIIWILMFITLYVI
jgi:heme/copper-type cytochrome/quinol oxidase subunit 3